MRLCDGSRLSSTAPAPRSRTYGSMPRPMNALAVGSAKMKGQGIEPARMLAMVAAFHLLRTDHPGEFKSDRHFNHQLAIRLLPDDPCPMGRTMGWRQALSQL